MDIHLYILESSENIVAISENESDIMRYIRQFQKYFDENLYSIKLENEKSNFYLERYMGRYLYDFTNSIILTDDEILYYRRLYFDEIYYAFKQKLAEIVYDPEILKLENAERRCILKQNTNYIKSVDTFDKFINKFSPQVLLRDYIREPILTFEL